MAVRIRLKRFGGKHDPHFRLVVADSRKQRDGRAIEELGWYRPSGDGPRLEVNAERALHWLSVGAQPSDTVRSLLVEAGVIEGPAGRESVQEAQAEPEAVPEAEAATENEAEDEEAEETAEEAAEETADQAQ